MGESIQTAIDAINLQADLNSLCDWSSQIVLDFNESKYVHLRFYPTDPLQESTILLKPILFQLNIMTGILV